MWRRFLSLTVLLCFVHTQAFALEYTPRKGQNYNLGTPSEFVFQSYPNQELVPIRLLGAVKKAGLYHVPKNMKLITLLSLAGGPTGDADLEKVMISNDKFSVKLKNQSKRKKLFGQPKAKASHYLNLEDSLEKGSEGAYVLKPNDIVLVKNKKPWISNDTWRVISILSVVLTSALTAMAIDDRL